ncbi:hypothetical protein KY325_02650 [Candidatus Woesearchaeota archaeon]|nr:hypothetical protein [Candidatus Woesearchaeota archaeon]MBW3018033.1 hypothetical protein [Candidatus Woesearchaeota archaeon]
MGEKLAVIEKKISYSGLFNARDLYNVFVSWISEKDWDLIEPTHRETVSETGKEIVFIFEPEKKMSDYVKFFGYFEIVLSGVEDVVIKRGEKEIPLNKGNVDIAIKGIIKTDYEGMWVSSPMHTVMKAFYEKFIKASEIKDFKKELTADIEHLNNQIKSHLNLFQYTK